MAARRDLSGLPPSTHAAAARAGAGNQEASSDSSDRPIPDEVDTVIDVGGRWDPPLDGDATPVVPTLSDSDTTPIVLTQRTTDKGATSPPAPRGAGDRPAPSVPPPVPPRSDRSSGPEPIRDLDPPSEWLSSRRARRPLPRGVRLAGAGLLGIVAVVALAGRCAKRDTTASVQTTYGAESDIAAHADDLRKRKEMVPEDFLSSPRVRVQDPPPEPSLEPSPTSGESLEARRARRADNPEYLEEVRHSRRRKRSQPTPPAEPPRRRSLIRYVQPPAGDAPAVASPPASVVPAATHIRGRLDRTLRLRGRRVTAIVRVGDGQPLPTGTKLVGDARADGEGWVQIRFSTAVLADGTDVRIDAEAQGVRPGQVADSTESDDGSIAGDVADSASRRTARAVLGDGLVGGLVDDTVRSSDRRSRRPRRRSTPTVTLRKGAAIDVLLRDAVELPQ